MYEGASDDGYRLCGSAKDQASPGSRHRFDQVRRYVDMLRCSQSVGSRGSTRHRIASRHPGPVHIDRRTAEEKSIRAAWCGERIVASGFDLPAQTKTRWREPALSPLVVQTSARAS